MEEDNQSPSPSESSIKTDYDAKIRVLYSTKNNKSEGKIILNHLRLGFNFQKNQCLPIV